MHEFEYKLTISCSDELCSDEGEEIFELTVGSFDGLEDKFKQMIACEDKHIEREEEYQEYMNSPEHLADIEAHEAREDRY